MSPNRVVDALRPYVRAAHYYDLAGFAPGDHVGLPSATVTLVLPLDPALDLTMPGAPRRVMDSCLAGLDDGPATIHHDGVQRGVQLALTPLGVRGLFGIPASAIAHQAVSLADVMGERRASALLDRVASQCTGPARLRAVEAELARHLDRDHRTRPELARAWSLLHASGGAARIRDIAADIGWSTRHLTQQFVAAVGTTPKTVARIVRFERSVALVRRGEDLASVALRCRYADQAHMTREWARLAGTTPTRWPRQDVLANVQDGRRAGVENRVA